MTGQSRIMPLVLWTAATLSVTAWAEPNVWLMDPGRLGVLKETSVLLGQPVKDTQEKEVGTVEDLLVDLPTGQVIVALVSCGTKGQTAPVPASSFNIVFSDCAKLNADHKLFESAPRLPRVDPPGTPEFKCLLASFHHFSQKTPELSAPSTGLTSCARLLGLRLVSQANEPLGQVKEVMVDLPLGQVVYLVIAPAAGLGSDYYVVPPVLAKVDAASHALALGADRAKFAAGPRFQKTFWTDLAFPDLAAAVRQHYSLKTAALGGVQVASVSSATTGANPTTPAPAAMARSDREITQAVMAEIVHGANGLQSLNIMVTTLNGRVTLKGPVRSEKQAMQVLAAAERIVGPGNVDNQLEYRGRKTAQL